MKEAVVANRKYTENEFKSQSHRMYARRNSIVVVQDCDTEENELKAYNNKRNPCQYGACVVEPFPQTPEFERVKCNCVTQYTGEFCNGKLI